MTLERRAPWPVAISALDVGDTHDLLLYGCEDCACAVSGDRVLSPTGAAPPDSWARNAGRWVAGREILDWPIDPEHRLLFNPVGHGGVVVVNEPAHRIFCSFRKAATEDEAQPDSVCDGDRAQQVIGRLADLGLIHLDGKVQRPEFSSGTVLTAWLHITNACNLRCPYCYISKSNEAMDETVGRAAVGAVIQSAVDNGFPAVKLKYAGGEASLNHRLMIDLHAYACELAQRRGLALYATMLSNGVALASSLIDTLRSAGIRVMISLDGVGRMHDAQRPSVNGKPSFRLVERGIERLVERDHAPHLSVTITNRNAQGIADVVRFALERDLTFSLNLFRDNDCATPFPDLRYEEQTIISGLLRAFEVIEEFLPRWSVLGSILDRGQLLEPRQRSCGVGQDYVVIDQRGSVSKCHMEIEKTLGDVFSSDPLQLVRQDRTTALNLAVDEKEGCRDCSWRYWCTGGCTVATFRATGRYDVKSPNCNIYKAIYPQALRLEALRLLKYASV
jgi:uncharacterized protein